MSPFWNSPDFHSESVLKFHHGSAVAGAVHSLTLAQKNVFSWHHKVYEINNSMIEKP